MEAHRRGRVLHLDGLFLRELRMHHRAALPHCIPTPLFAAKTGPTALGGVQGGRGGGARADPQRHDEGDPLDPGLHRAYLSLLRRVSRCTAPRSRRRDLRFRQLAQARMVSVRAGPQALLAPTPAGAEAGQPALRAVPPRLLVDAPPAPPRLFCCWRGSTRYRRSSSLVAGPRQR